MRDEYDISKLNPRENPYAKKFKRDFLNKDTDYKIYSGNTDTDYNAIENRDLTTKENISF